MAGLFVLGLMKMILVCKILFRNKQGLVRRTQFQLCQNTLQKQKVIIL
ncbi:MAG: hypothetical protein JWQ38_3598 [Flavipsychrobacter sp.]|nr:hypothetical protein [Flavipsychrobacter sp.]